MRTFLTVLVLVILQWHVLLSTPKRNDLSETKEQPVAEALQRAQGRPGASRVRSEKRRFRRQGSGPGRWPPAEAHLGGIRVRRPRQLKGPLWLSPLQASCEAEARMTGMVADCVCYRAPAREPTHIPPLRFPENSYLLLSWETPPGGPAELSIYSAPQPRGQNNTSK